MSAPRWFIHANVNTADVAAGERFYAEVLGLSPVTRTAPVQPQDGSGFGMAGVEVRWVGVLLGDRRGGRGPQVDLLEWKLPPTTGRPATDVAHLGHSALRFGISDLDGAARRVSGRGGGSHWRLDDPDGEREIVLGSDPDGTRLELLPAATGPVYTGVRVNCSNLERSVAFYSAAAGLDAGPERRVSVRDEAGSAVGRFRARRMHLPSQAEQFHLEMTEWEEPRPSGAAASPGNHAGIYRVALSVDDMEESLAQVRTVAPDAPPAVEVDVGEQFPLVLACFFPDPDGAIVEFIERRAATRQG
jgi:catechol 2,3-dioxygenase-like lactoylglutathione lyase family enzyme